MLDLLSCDIYENKLALLANIANFLYTVKLQGVVFMRNKSDFVQRRLV